MNRSRIGSAVCIFTSLFALIHASWSPVLASEQTDSAARALSWLKTQQSCDGSIPSFSVVGGTADAVIAIVAGGGSPHSWTTSCGATPISFLKQRAGDPIHSAGAIGKITIAADLSGESVRNFGGVDLVARIRSKEIAGKYGLFLFDQALAMLGLAAAGEPVPPSSVAHLLSQQGVDGGWTWTGVPGADLSDTNSTSVAIQALAAARANSPLASAIDVSIARAALFLRISQTSGGGFPYQKVGAFCMGLCAADSSSTAYSIQALRAAGQTPPRNSITALKGFQNSDGSFSYQIGLPGDTGSTSQSTAGILEKSLVCLIGIHTCPAV